MAAINALIPAGKTPLSCGGPSGEVLGRNKPG
jgi:hypothetical protein